MVMELACDALDEDLAMERRSKALVESISLQEANGIPAPLQNNSK